MTFGGPTPGAQPRDAATVVVLRNTPRGLELFCVERHRRSGFMGGAVVFPGGKVDAGDRLEAWSGLATSLGPRADEFSDDPATARAFAVAALREALEEAAILPVVGDGLDAAGTLALRRELAAETADDAAFAQALARRGLVLDAGRLHALSRWITPEAEPKRFDTRFYVLALPPGQEGAHDDHETTRSFWATPADLLARWERGEIVLAPPTSWTITLFAGAANVEAAFGVAARQPLEPMAPCFVNDGDSVILTLPGDPLHPDPALAARDTGGPTRFVLEGQRFVAKRGRTGS